MKQIFEQPQTPESMGEMTPKEVREVMSAIREVVNDEVLKRADDRIQGIKDALRELFEASELEQSPYWHAFAGSTVGENLAEADESNQKLIAKKIIEYTSEYLLPILKLEVEQAYTSELLINIENFRKELSADKNLSVFFSEKARKLISEIQAEFPDYYVRKIPELDRLTGGSEARFPDIPQDVVSKVMTMFATKYRELREEYIEKSNIR